MSDTCESHKWYGGPEAPCPHCRLDALEAQVVGHLNAHRFGLRSYNKTGTDSNLPDAEGPPCLEWVDPTGPGCNPPRGHTGDHSQPGVDTWRTGRAWHDRPEDWTASSADEYPDDTLRLIANTKSQYDNTTRWLASQLLAERKRSERLVGERCTSTDPCPCCAKDKPDTVTISRETAETMLAALKEYQLFGTHKALAELEKAVSK